MQRDLILNQDQFLASYVAPLCIDGSSIEELIFAFLRAKAARTQSIATVKAYQRTVFGFRDYLQKRGWDLIMYTKEERGWEEYRFIRSKLSTAASDYSLLSKTPGRLLKDTSRNRTLAALSSFYQYADTQNKTPFTNPISMVERSPIDEYDGAEALPTQDVRITLEEIDRSTLLGLRDYALLQLLFTTGSRVGAALALTMGDLRRARSGLITVHFAKMKGGKETTRELSEGVSTALVTYIEAFYGPWQSVEKKKPVWVALTNGPHFHYGDSLKYQAVRDLCQKYLGVTKVHTTRHTFSKAMYDAGASIDDVQEQLEHSDPMLTKKHYMKFKKRENTYRDTIAQAFGENT